MSDRTTTEELWRAHRGFVAVVLLAYRRRGADLDDLLQEVALTLTRRIHELRDPARVRPWLRKIAMHVALGEARRAAVGPGAAPLSDQQPAVDVGPTVPESLMVRDEVRRVLGMALQLPADLREPLLLRSVDGMSQHQIADALGVSEEAVESRLARARRRLREQIREGSAAMAEENAVPGGE